MNKFNFNPFILLLLIPLMYGCKKDENIPSIANGSQTVKENKLIWEVSGNGLEEPFHLFGSIHLIERDKLSYLSAIEAILETSSGLVLETDITDPSIADAARSRMFLPSKVKPKSYYTDEQWTLMSDVCQRVDFSIGFIEQVKPTAVMSLIFPNLLNQNKAEFTSYEEELIKLASIYNVKTSGLESENYVYTYFDSIPLAGQYEGLYETMNQYDKNPRSVRAEYEELVNAYQNQDINQLLDYGKEDQLAYEQFIVKRNHHWLTEINESFAGKLVTVGAGHLAGDEGLLELLVQKGYSIKAIN